MMRPLYFILMLFLAACASAPAPLPQPAASHTVISSPNDDRQYRYVELPNRLKVVLIADAASDKAAAALTVFRGSAHDPKAYPGLAHFLEHMLFIGTGKYPEVDGYQQFLSAHGGSSNAYTADDHTNFFFDVAPDRFPEALDRFAQFFISPLMSAEYVDREKNAVDSEYQMQRKDDAWRSHMAGMLLMNQQHPITRFNIGNLDTLKGDVRGALLTFFESHYSSDQMALVVLAPDSLDDLEALVRERFSAIRDKQLGPDDPDVRVYDETLLPARIDVKPVQEIREISYAFPVPALRPWYQLKPEVYIANLLGHEGEGSLFATLKALGWATGLSASSNDLDVDESEITVSIALTEEGARHLDEISGYLFAAIDLIRQEAPQAWRQHELALVGELGFRFMEKGSALRTVYALAPVLMRYPPEEMLRYRYIASGFDPALVQRYLSFLRPDNVAVEVVLPEAQTNAVEPWFNVDYALKRGPITVTPPRSQGRTALSLPPPNPFLPENLELVKGEDGLREIDDSAAVDYWLHTDTTFGVPKANIRFNLNLDGGITTPRDHAAARLYADLVADAANQWAYATLLAGMNANVSARPAGFRFDITGYADKQLELADRVVALFATLHIDPARFDILKQDLLRTLENSTDDKPYQQVMAAVGTSLHGSVWPDADVAGALKALTPEDLDAWRQQHLARVGFLGLAHGNVEQSRADAILAAVERHLHVDKVNNALPEPAALRHAASIELPIDHDDAAIAAYIQEPDRRWRTRALSALGAHLMQQAFFTSLRTEQQLGYVVGMAAQTIDRQPGLLMLVQSPSAGPDAIVKAIDTFLVDQGEVIRALSAQRFDASREGLLVKLLEADKNLGERTERYWNDLDEGITTFDSRQRLADAIRALTQEDVAAWADALPRRFREESLIVSARGKHEALPPHGRAFRDVADFKRHQIPVDTAATNGAATPHTAG